MIELLRPVLPSKLVPLLVALTLVAAACGSSSDDAADTVEAASDTTIQASSDTADDVPDEEGSDSGGGDDAEADDAEADDTDSSDADSSPAGDESADGPTAARLGDRVLVSSLAATTGRFEGRISVSGGEDLPDGIELVFSGAFDSVNDASEISIDLGAVAMAAAEQEGADLGPMAAMFDEPMIVRTIGSTSYISWGLFSLLTGGEGTWIEAEAGEAGDITSTFGGTGNGSPIDLLSTLEDANAEITEIGSEDVRGVSTTHIRAVVDVAGLEESLTDEERATLERDLGDVPTEAFPIDFWIDEDGQVRRYSMDLSQAAQADGDFEQAGLVFEFFDFGADIAIEAPPADEIVSSDAFDLGAFGFGN